MEVNTSGGVSASSRCHGIPGGFRAALCLLAALAFPAIGFAAPLETVPRQLTFQGYLTDSGGTPVNGTTETMRFGIYISGVRQWYAEYAAVALSGGHFSVQLGASSQGGAALDPTLGASIAASNLPIPASAFGLVTSASLIEVEVEIWNGSAFDLVTPRYAMASAIFALKADTIDGLDSTQLAQVDSSGNIKSSGGNAVISPTGSWIGPAITTSGANGQSGASGASGNSGPSGASGATGATGALGSQGLQGFLGGSGASGATGASGLMGSSGATGATGAGASGNSGSSGATGQSGATGPTGSGQAGATGLSGATGASGASGATGATGADGAVGRSGATGASGNIGVSGATGASGNSGLTGATGYTGAQGASGATGASGNSGLTGATGGTGNQGGSGATGASGNTGLSGATGATGAQGNIGNTGLSGATGGTGATGASGGNGASGASGVSGATGASGAAGGNGSSGATGATGPAGTSQWITASSDIYYSSGSVGIGAASPQAMLHLSGSAPGLRIEDTSGAGTVFDMDVISSTQIEFRRQGMPAPFIFTQGSTEALRIDSSGNLGVGTTNPLSKVSVAGTIESTTGGFKFPDGTTQTTASTPAAATNLTRVTHGIPSSTYTSGNAICQFYGLTCDSATDTSGGTQACSAATGSGWAVCTNSGVTRGIPSSTYTSGNAICQFYSTYCASATDLSGNAQSCAAATGSGWAVCTNNGATRGIPSSTYTSGNAICQFYTTACDSATDLSGTPQSCAAATASGWAHCTNSGGVTRGIPSSTYTSGNAICQFYSTACVSATDLSGTSQSCAAATGSGWALCSAGSCPSGYTNVVASGRFIGCLQTTANTAATYTTAVDNCYTNSGAVLPSFNQEHLGYSKYSFTIGSPGDWVDGVGGSGFGAMISNTGSPITATSTVTETYRCWIPAGSL